MSANASLRLRDGRYYIFIKWAVIVAAVVLALKLFGVF
jgi:hypothetical protein